MRWVGGRVVVVVVVRWEVGGGGEDGGEVLVVVKVVLRVGGRLGGVGGKGAVIENVSGCAPLFLLLGRVGIC